MTDALKLAEGQLLAPGGLSHAVLEKVLSDPIRYVQEPNHFGHIYAIELLGHFREPRAHHVIVDLFSWPAIPARCPARLVDFTRHNLLPRN